MEGGNRFYNLINFTIGNFASLTSADLNGFKWFNIERESVVFTKSSLYQQQLNVKTGFNKYHEDYDYCAADYCMISI